MKKKFLAFVMLEPSRTSGQNPSSELPLIETHEIETEKALTEKKDYDGFIDEIKTKLTAENKVKYKRCVITGLMPML